MPSPKKKPAAKAKKKAAPSKPAVVGEKKDLIRSFPPSTPASVIIAAGAKKGLKLTPKYVYTTRSGDKSRPPREPRDRALPASKKNAKLARVARAVVRAGESPAERAFRVACCAAMVGMDREEVERIAREVLGGFESAAKRRAS